MIHRILIFCCFWLVVAHLATAQKTLTPDRYNADFNVGEDFFNRFAYKIAIKHYKKAYEKDTVSTAIKYRLAQSYYRMRDMEEAEFWANKLVAQNYELSTNEVYSYIEILASNQHYDEAGYWYTQYLKMDSTNEDHIERMKGFLQSPDFKNDASFYQITPISANSPKSDFSPISYKEGLVFVSARRKGFSMKSIFKNDGIDYFNLYYAQENEDGTFGEPAYFNKKVKSEFHEGPIAFYDDYKKVIFTQSSRVKRALMGKRPGKGENGETNLKLYQADIIDGSIKNVLPFEYNSEDFSTGHPTVSDDGKKLIFSSNRSDGNGGSDLFICYRINENHWSPPRSLGDEVNTEGKELFPYLNGNVLYFASDGHPGLGGLDVFRTVLVNDKPTEVINMGYPINSNYDDFGAMTHTGKSGYFSSNRGNPLNDDIYSVVFSKPPPVLTARVKAIDSVSNETLLGVSIRVIDTLTAEDLVPMNVEGDSVHVYVLDTAKVYKIKANVSGYFPNDLIEESDTEPDGVFEWVVPMNVIKPNEPFVLNDIFYDFDKATLRDSSRIQLNYIINWLEENPEIKIEIHAHTDNVGPEDYNMGLSQRRAQSVVDYLEESGIEGNRLVAVGYGESQPRIECPKPSDCTKEQHQQNRRTEMMVLEETTESEESQESTTTDTD